MGHFMWLNLIKEGCVPLQDPWAGPSGSQTQRALPSPALTAPGSGLLSERIPARWAYQAGGLGPNQRTPCWKLGWALGRACEEEGGEGNWPVGGLTLLS